jgi:hypothetical protein
MSKDVKMISFVNTTRQQQKKQIGLESKYGKEKCNQMRGIIKVEISRENY